MNKNKRPKIKIEELQISSLNPRYNNFLLGEKEIDKYGSLWNKMYLLGNEEPQIHTAANLMKLEGDFQDLIILLESLSEDGFNDKLDSVIALKNKEEEYIVIEGNRRVMALKFLRDKDFYIATINRLLNIVSKDMKVPTHNDSEEPEIYLNPENDEIIFTQNNADLIENRGLEITESFYDNLQKLNKKINSIYQKNKNKNPSEPLNFLDNVFEVELILYEQNKSFDFQNEKYTKKLTKLFLGDPLVPPVVKGNDLDINRLKTFGIHTHTILIIIIIGQKMIEWN